MKAVKNCASDRLYAFVVGHGLFVNADDGKGWRLVSTVLPQDVMAPAPLPKLGCFGGCGPPGRPQTHLGRSSRPAGPAMPKPGVQP